MKKILISLAVFLLNLNFCYAQIVVYNVKTHKIHKPSCPSATKCTTNCIKIEKKAAQARGGIPCKKCGG